MYDILELNKKLVPELKEIAKELNIKRIELLKKQDLVYKILDTQAIRESEITERKTVDNEQKKEEEENKSFLVKKPFTPENKNTQQEELRGNRPRRERIEPVVKREKVETGKKKHVQKESTVQSRQEQIKAIIKGFGREKIPVVEPEQKIVTEKPVQKEEVKPELEKREKVFHPKQFHQKEKFQVDKQPQRTENPANLDIPEDLEEQEVAGIAEIQENQDVAVIIDQENSDQQQISQKPKNDNQNQNQNGIYRREDQ